MVEASLIGEPPLNMYSRNTCTILQIPECPQIIEILRPKGDILLRPSQETPQWIGKPRKFWGIFGILELANTRCLVLIENCTLVGSLFNSHIFRVDSLYYHALVDKHLHDLSDRDKTLITMINTLAKDRSFYFSYDLDLTVNIQEQLKIRSGLKYVHEADNKETASYTEPRFRFNLRNMKLFNEITPLHEAYDLKLIYGFVYIRPVVLRDARLDFAIISKKDVRKLGRRFLSRGLDQDGNVSNFVETEQLVIVTGLESGGPVSIGSYLEIRGSIPLFWRQKITGSWMPKGELVKHKDWDQEQVGRRHIEESLQKYGDMVLINLINKKGKEGRLGDQFTNFIDRLGLEDKVMYEWFDFHKECAKMQWQNISKLIETIQKKLDTFGYFSAQIESSNIHFTRVSQSNIKIIEQQKGIVRTNCMDCLDRTNVVQSVIARQILHNYLASLKLTPERGTNPFEEFPQALELLFREGWTCNANMLSRLYTGTPALKTDFTLTGKRTMMGALQDGKNSLHRYYLNNFNDGYFQDCLEFSQGQLKAGNEKSDIKGAQKVKFRKPPTHRRAILCSLIFLIGGLFLMNFVAAFLFGSDSDSWTSWLKSTFMSNLTLLFSLLILLKSLQCNLRRYLSFPTRKRLLGLPSN